MTSTDRATERVREQRERGAAREQIVQRLREEGFDAITATKALRAGLPTSLQEAKDALMDSDAWSDVAERSASLHDDLEALARVERSRASGRRTDTDPELDELA